MSSTKELARLIRKATMLDLEMKAKKTELDEVKTELYPILSAGDTYLGEANTTVLVKATATFNAAAAQAHFGAIPEATEAKVTPASLKAYLQAKHPKKWEEKLEEFYNRGTSLTFGVRQ